MGIHKYIIFFILILCIGCMKVVKAVYISDGGDKISVSFKKDTVKFKFKDDNEVILNRDVSASGIRYTNKNKVFWEHQGYASYFVDSKLVFYGKKK